MLTLLFVPAVMAGDLVGADPVMTDQGEANSQLGARIAALGDANGDGFADFGAGDDFSDPADPWSHPRTVNVYYGGPGGPAGPTELDHGDHAPGPLMEGVGDVDDDGFDDTAMDPGTSGYLQLYHGGVGGLTVDDHDDLIAIAPDDGSDLNGHGDVDGDGVNDLARLDPGFGGEAADDSVRLVVSYLGSGGASSYECACDNPAWDWNNQPFDMDGDLNGDGYADLVQGASTSCTAEWSGRRLAVYFGGAPGLRSSPDWTDAGEYAEYLGFSVDMGDVDGDGVDDLAASAPWEGNSGSVHLYLGGAGGPVDAQVLSHGDTMGIDVALGDLNGDGLADLVSGSTTSNFRREDIYLFTASEAGFSATPDQVLSAPSGVESFGHRFEIVGDTNRDGAVDLAVAAPDDSNDYPGWIGLYLGAVAVDADGDGASDAVDCAPGDAARGPNLPESCDGLDNDCDGAVDDGLPAAYIDADGDGIGTGEPSCAGSAATSGDCDDGDAAIHPGASDSCGLDNDCDGAKGACPEDSEGGTCASVDAPGSWVGLLALGLRGLRATPRGRRDAPSSTPAARR